MANWGLLLYAAVAVQPGQGEVLTLDEALKIAEGNSFAIAIARTDVERTRQQIAEARGNLGPRVTAGATYSRLEAPSTGAFSQPPDSTQAQLSVSMPIDITGVLGRGIRATEVFLRAAEERVEVQRNDLREEVRRNFFSVLQAEALVSVAREALANSRERLQVTQKEFEAGTKARVDVLRAETEVRQNEQNLLSAENRVRLAKNALNNSLGRPIETPFEPAPIAGLPEVNATPDQLVERAHDERPEIEAQEFNIEGLRWLTRAQEGGLAPSLSVSAVHQRNLGAIGFAGSRQSTTAQIGLNFPIFDSGVTRARVRQARQDELAAQVQLDQLRLAVSLEVRQAMTNLIDARARLDVAEQQVKVAAENYRLARVRYENDEAIQLEVIDAQTELTRAQTTVVTARYEYLTAYAALQRAVAADDVSAAGGKD